MDVRFQDGTRETIRLLGVDAPEDHTETGALEFEGIPDTTAGHDRLRDWGHKASEFARIELAGDEVRIVVDEHADRRGSFGRLLVYVYDDGQLFNLQLLQQGYARLYDTSFSKRDSFSNAEETAQADDVGLWNFEKSTPTPTPTDDTSEGSLAVVRIHEDADGNDLENENDEYVVFENTGDEALDLSEWTVRDEAGHTYQFPAGFTLPAGGQVTLYTGSGTDS